MNCIEKEMIDLMKFLKDECGCIQIKAEFEAEGTRPVELSRLKDVTSSVGLPLIMKIGGAESVTDVYSCLEVGVAGIIAPMIETGYALYKYENLIDKMIPHDNAEDIEFFFNMETITGYQNLDDMMATPLLKFIQGCTIGRVDLAGSMGKDRSAVDSDEFYQICRNTFKKTRAQGLKNGLGGAVSDKSIDFIKKLRDEGLIDKFETRKVVFAADAIDMGSKIFSRALEFELLWLKSKRRYYSACKAEDENRIAMLEKRFSTIQ